MQEGKVFLYNLCERDLLNVTEVLKEKKYKCVNIIEKMELDEYFLVQMYSDFEKAVCNSDLVILGYDEKKTIGKELLNKILYLERNNVPHIKTALLKKYCNKICNVSIQTRETAVTIPMILVLGMGEMTDTVSVEQYLYRKFEENQYAVMHISDEEYFDLKGAENIPPFLEENISISDKKDRLSKWMEEKLEDQLFDVAIIGLSEDTIDIVSEKRDLNEVLLCWSDLFKFDYVILCGYNAMFEPKALEPIYNTLKYRYNVDVDAICISNRKPMMLDEIDRTAEYVLINSVKNLKENQYFIPDIWKSSLYEKIINEFTGEIELI